MLSYTRSKNVCFHLNYSEIFSGFLMYCDIFKAMQFLLPFINSELNKTGLGGVYSAIFSSLVFGQQSYFALTVSS